MEVAQAEAQVAVEARAAGRLHPVAAEVFLAAVEVLAAEEAVEAGRAISNDEIESLYFPVISAPCQSKCIAKSGAFFCGVLPACRSLCEGWRLKVWAQIRFYDHNRN